MTGRVYRLGWVVLLFGMAGCHHHDTVPVPAAASAPAAGAGRVPAVRPVPGIAAAKTPAPVIRVPEQPAEGMGRPVSTEVGMASWYAPYMNRKAADGSTYDGQGMTAAHRTLPMGTMVRVTNLTNNESVIVKITDRGPFVANRTLDLSIAAAKAIGVYKAGLAQVKIEAFAKPGADPEGRWCVQIGAFIAQDDAVQLKNDLLSRYKAAKVIEFAGPTGYWVRINPAAADKVTANRIAEGIHIPDALPYVVRTN